MIASPAILIQKKRDGEELSFQEIQSFIHGLLKGEVADYQATALLMAVFFQGMTLDETVALTRVMLESGERYDLSDVPGPKVDKHSTGGVGDKVSLILAPLAAACGLKVPMMAGRGLGHSGGTLDKLESIPGFQVRLTRDLYVKTLKSVGCAIIGQSERIVPADQKLYALRDVTATIECVPLIVGSILSKKMAEGTQGLVLDVKHGSGAFMKEPKQARVLAKTLLQVAAKMKLPCRAVLSDMNQPLGYSAGNSLEVIECIEVMRGKRSISPDLLSADLKELTISLCAQMLELGKVVKNRADGRKLALARLEDGSAWTRFEQMVEAQGGDVNAIRDTERLPKSSKQTVWKARKRGYVTAMDTEAIGRLLVSIGAGRKKASDSVDPSVGMLFHRKLGARVQPGDPLVTIHSADGVDLAELEHLFQAAITCSSARKPVPKLLTELSA